MARDASLIQTEIKRLESALSSGVRSVTTDGVTTTFESSDALRKRLGELRNELVEAGGGTMSRKPRVRSLNLESMV